jgi:hypothetical protein
MRVFIYLLLSTILHKIYSIKPNQSIKNINIPSCKNCIYFEPSLYNSDYLSRCTKFGEKNIITDEINHDFANSCRKTDEKCGLEGKSFVKETDINLLVRDIQNYWKLNSTYFIVGGISILYIGNIILSAYLIPKS